MSTAPLSGDDANRLAQCYGETGDSAQATQRIRIEHIEPGKPRQNGRQTRDRLVEFARQGTRQ
jgi:hypothetical protein